MEIFARVMTSCSTSRPLEDDGVVWIGGGDVDDLSNTVDRSCDSKISE